MFLIQGLNQGLRITLGFFIIWATREASSGQFSHSVMSDSMRPHELQDARPPCQSPTPGVYPNSCHWVNDAIQPSHPLLFPTTSSFNLPQHQGPFQGVSSSHQVAKVLESFNISLPMNIQDWSPLGWTGWISLQSKGFSELFSNTTVQKHPFFGTQLSLYSNSHTHTWLLEKP